MEGDRGGQGEVVALTSEDRVRAYVHGDVQVASSATVLPGSTAALEPDPLAVGNTGRNPNLHGLGGLAPAGAVAHRARVIDDHAPTATVPARLGHGEDTAGGRGLHAAALTGGADLWNRPGPSAGAATGLAGSVGDHLHPDGDALDRLDEVHRDLALDVAAATWPAGGGEPRGLRGGTAVEQAAEDVAETASGIAEEVVDQMVRSSGYRAPGKRKPPLPNSRRASSYSLRLA